MEQVILAGLYLAFFHVAIRTLVVLVDMAVDMAWACAEEGVRMELAKRKN